jgi:urease accessory protein
MRSAGSRVPSSGRTVAARRRRTAPTSGVGRVGALALEYVRQDERTVFGRTTCQTPWHLLPPIYLDESGSAYTLLVNPSGGLVGGDHLSIDLSVGPRAQVLISTPSANRVYRSLSDEAVQDISIKVAGEGMLEWLPEHTIPFAGSRFRQKIDVQLHAGSVLLLWDAIASGRIAHGERWRFASLDNQIRITLPSYGSVQERAVIVPEETGGAGLAADWDYVGSLFVVGDAVAPAQWTSLESRLAHIIDRYRADGVLAGVSQPAIPGVVVKLVARSAPIMTRMFMELWAEVRMALWQMPPASLRKY